MGYIVLAFVVAVLTLVMFGNRWRLKPMLSVLNATMVGKTIWFQRRGAWILLTQTTPYGTYTWDSFKKGVRTSGFSPLFTLSIPIEKNDFWFIRRGGPLPFDNAFGFGRKTAEADACGKKFLVWAHNENQKSHLLQSISTVAPKIELALAQNIGWGNVSTTREPRFYRWRPRFGWYLEVSGLPEKLHTDPAQVLKSVDAVLDVIGGLGISVKKGA